MDNRQLDSLVKIGQLEKEPFSQLYGFAKNQHGNIDTKELQALKLLAAQLLGYASKALARVVKCGELIEVQDEQT